MNSLTIHELGLCILALQPPSFYRPTLATGVDLIVKNIGLANQNIWGQKAVKSDKYMSVSAFPIIGGTCPGCPPKVYAYDTRQIYSECRPLIGVGVSHSDVKEETSRNDRANKELKSWERKTSKLGT